jgi:hypothetical protein
MQSVILNNASADLLIWEPAISGTYSAKSAYTWLLDKDNNRLSHDSNWSWIWKLQVSEKIRSLSGLLYMGKYQTTMLGSTII